MSLVMDHVIILVDDLERASADFEALGFTVTPGGEHGEGLTHNALIHFADGTFFELFAYKRGWRASVLRWLYRAGGLGFLAPPGTATRTLDPTHTHGANIRLVATDLA
jgi:hypothetical protein